MWIQSGSDIVCVLLRLDFCNVDTDTWTILLTPAALCADIRVLQSDGKVVGIEAETRVK